ncbi:MAG TPA: hypothetical protein VNH83_24470, partial [Bryobacteraceae bacterium]|nr:hypothetical protein [Bryobacteraceae bacterium]
RPINLALLGPRAAGKTSFLNVIQYQSEALGYCPVRIDLNEGDINQEHDFFFKILDSVINAVCEKGAFGGLNGRTYDAYLATAYSFQVPDDRTFCPFLFPIQYAKVKAAGSAAYACVSDNSLKRDLAAIYDELKKPIVLLFDECNVLVQSRVLLEKIRNLFMNTKGYMLVLTGTPDLFPLIDDVFSPIVRQFKKIQIGPFKTPAETAACIRRPLEVLKTVDISEIIDLDEDSDTVREIHELAGGKPYEIKLICHMLFRKLQQDRATRMLLTFSVLEDVRQELENFQDVSARPVLAKIQSFNARQLSALALLPSGEGQLSFEDTWTLHYAVHGARFWSREQLEQEFRLLLDSKIIEVDVQQRIKFIGDEFDKIYIKYLARERRVRSRFWSSSIGEFVATQLEMIPVIRKAALARFIAPARSGHDISGLITKLTTPDGKDPYEEQYLLTEMAYKWIVSRPQNEDFRLITLEITFAETTVSFWFDPEAGGGGNQDELLDRLNGLVSRSERTAWRASVHVVVVRSPGVESLAAQVLTSANLGVRRDLALWHSNQLGLRYTEKDLVHARLHADLAVRYARENTRVRANSGYFAMADGNLELAETLLVSPSDDSSTGLLVSYNLAMLRSKQGRIDEARGILESLVTKAQTLPNPCVCLFVPTRNGSVIELVEERGNLQLGEVATRAIQVLRSSTD